MPVLEDMFNMPGISASPNAKTVEGASCAIGYSTRGQDNTIGQLIQRYAVIQAERNAALANMRTRRVNDDKTGQIHLDVTHG